MKTRSKGDAEILRLLREQEINPVLMEVGAEGKPPTTWNKIGSQSTYVGIGPEASRPQLFKETHIVRKVVTITDTEERALLYITKDALYSSVLKPDPSAIAEFVDPDLTRDKEVLVPATTIDAVVTSLPITGIDWFRTNINGIDVPAFQSVVKDTRERVLAVDTCFDLVSLFIGQNSDVDKYPEFVNQGFWLSRVFSYGPIRMRRESLAKIAALETSIDQRYVSDYHRRTPGWLFVRFFRTVEWLAERASSSRDYLVLWTFALLDEQVGFAVDVLTAYERRFGQDRLFKEMQRETIVRFKALRQERAAVKMAMKFFPAPVEAALRRIWRDYQNASRSSR